MHHFMIANQHAHRAGSARGAIRDRYSRGVGELIHYARTEGTYVLLNVGGGTLEAVWVIVQDVKVARQNQYG